MGREIAWLQMVFEDISTRRLNVTDQHGSTYGEKPEQHVRNTKDNRLVKERKNQLYIYNDAFTIRIPNKSLRRTHLNNKL